MTKVFPLYLPSPRWSALTPTRFDGAAAKPAHWGQCAPPANTFLLVRIIFRYWRLALLFLFSATLSFAHNPLSSWAIVQLQPDTFELKVELAADSAWLFLGETLDAAPQIEREMPRLQAKAKEVYQVSLNGKILTPRETSVELHEEDGVEFHLFFARPASGALHFEATYLRMLPANHRTILTMLDEKEQTVRSEIFYTSKPAVTIELPPITAPTGAAAPVAGANVAPVTSPPIAATPTVSFRDFLLLGIEHILTGYDHLLFLGGLLIACRRPRSMLIIVTCFTLAHSITLALAALNIVNLSSRIVEPLIAASIVFVGVENLLRREEPKGRWLLTFGFGLIHGFGFASALRTAGLGSSGSALAVPLFAFNLGVELGQLAVIAVLLPVYLITRNRPEFARFTRPALSTLVALAGAWWLVQRTVLS